MNPYDHASVAAVWKRVAQEKQTDCLETALCAAIADERSANQTYLAMARCGHCELLRQIAAQEACHAHRLSALYYLLYGCQPCRNETAQPKICNFCEAIRKAYASELEAAKTYGELAKQYPEHAQLFCAIMQAEQHHACLLRSLTERIL